MRPTTRAKRNHSLEEDELRQLNDLSFSSVIADIASSEERPPKDSKRSRHSIDLESTHTDRTINELLAGAVSAGEGAPDPELRVTSDARADAEASEATEDLIAPDVLFPELTLKD